MPLNPSSNVASLDQAYQATLYEVFAHHETIQLRVNATNTSLDQLLQDHQVATWALITAYNPYSQQLTAQENHRRNQSLRKVLGAMELSVLDAVGRDESGQWPPEKSLFTLGMSRTQAIDIGGQFSQNAILYGELGQPVELLWLVDQT